MIDFGEAREIRRQYEKHGWTLRRVLLSDAAENFSALENSFGDVAVVSSDINALWFSRVAPGGEAWELRRLSGAPFALVATFPIGTSESARKERLNEMEKAVAAKS